MVTRFAGISIEHALEMARRILPVEETKVEEKEEIVADLRFKKWLCKRSSLMNIMYDDILSNDRELRFIKGHIQSGKTKALIAYAIGRIHLCKVSSVILVRNYNCDAVQLNSGIMTAYIKYAEKISSLFKHPDVCFAGDSRPNNLKLMQSILKHGNGIIICLANSAQIVRVLCQYGSLEKRKPFDLVVDEMDEIQEKGKNSKAKGVSFATNMSHIIEASEKKIGISGTIFDVIFAKNGLKSERVFKLVPDDSYRGITDIIRRELPYEKLPTFPKKYHYCDRDPYAIEFYVKLSEKQPIEFTDGSTHPIVCLHRTSQFKRHHRQFSRRIIENPVLKDKWAVIIYNGDGIIMYHHSLKGATVEIETVNGIEVVFGNESKLDRISLDDVGTTTGIHTFEKITIKDALQFLKENVEVTHILIISGKLASRGVNFVSADFEWHLTHMYLLMSQPTTCAALLQSMRLCGCYPDSGPLKLFSYKQTLTDLIKAYDIQEKFVENIEGKNVLMNEHYKEVPLLKSKMPKKVLSKAYKYKSNLNIVNKLNSNNGDYFLINEENVTGQVKRLMVRHTVDILTSNGHINTDIERTELSNMLVSLNINGIDSIQQIKATFDRIRDDDSTIKITDKNTNGLVYWQSENDKWNIRLNV